MNSTQNQEYSNWVVALKSTIKQRQIKAAIAVNSNLIMMYWDLGKQIVEKQENTKWGSGFIDQLSKDLKSEFPDIKGFSTDNIRYCKVFYLFYRNFLTWEPAVPKFESEIVHQLGGQNNDIEIVRQPAGQIHLEIIPQVVGQLEDDIVEQPVQEIKNDTSISEQLVRKIESADYQEIEIHEQVVRELEKNIFEIPWGHHILILKKVKNQNEAFFYINQTIKNNWSRSVLEYQIETNLYSRQGTAINNFSETLSQVQGDLAKEILKDPYNFEFLTLASEAKEKDLEQNLIQSISKFLLELGKGFAYLGRQFQLKIGNKDYRTDLLFYHTKLKCYIVIELKLKEFEPEFIGKLNFYISAINELVKEPNDQPTIGILLCKTKDNFEVEFALKDINKPIGVSEFKYTQLPENIKQGLPTLEELENELRRIENI